MRPAARAMRPPTTLSPSVVPAPTPRPVEALWQADGGSPRLNRPLFLALGSQDQLYIQDTTVHRIVTLDQDGTVLRTWGSQGSGPGQFQFREADTYVGGIAIDGRGAVYVSDGSHRIQVFSAAGRFRASWGSHGRGAGQLDHPGEPLL